MYKVNIENIISSFIMLALAVALWSGSTWANRNKDDEGDGTIGLKVFLRKIEKVR